MVIIDALYARKPSFSPEAVTGEFCTLLKAYNIFKVIGDKYGGGYPAEQFGKFAITYEQSPNRSPICMSTCCRTSTPARIAAVGQPAPDLTAHVASSVAAPEAVDRYNRPSSDGATTISPTQSPVSPRSTRSTQPTTSSYAGWSDNPNADRETGCRTLSASAHGELHLSNIRRPMLAKVSA